LPSPEARELALLLERKAEGDESILDKVLDDHDVPDDVLGFHVQQAVEKRLKVAYAVRVLVFDFVEREDRLTSLLEQHGLDLPGCREEMRRLEAAG
jgi:hypothetical protein